MGGGWVEAARSMCGGSGLGFDRDGGAEVENGREEEMRKKREKRGSLAGLVGRRDLGGGAAGSRQWGGAIWAGPKLGWVPSSFSLLALSLSLGFQSVNMGLKVN